MSAVRPWSSVRPTEPSSQPNPGAGQGWARVPNERSGGDMNPTSGATWHPTVVNLLVLIAIELVAYGVLRYVFREALGS